MTNVPRDDKTEAAMRELAAQIDAMAISVDRGIAGPGSPKTVRGTTFVSFCHGERHSEAQEHSVSMRLLKGDELIRSTLSAVSLYRLEFGDEPVRLVWRQPPLYEVNGLEHNIWLRLAFEPLEEEPTAHTTGFVDTSGMLSFAEARAKAAGDATMWEARDALQSLLRRIDAGEIKADRLVIHYREPQPDGSFRQFHCVAGVDFESHLAMLVLAQAMLLEEWRG